MKAACSWASRSMVSSMIALEVCISCRLLVNTVVRRNTMGRRNTAGLTGCRAKESDPIRVTLAAEGAIHRASRNTRTMHTEREVEAAKRPEGGDRAPSKT